MKIVPLSALRDNYIWALCTDSGCVVVDPGEAAPVRAFLAREQLPLLGILLTHRHHDHIDGVPALAEAGKIPIYGPASEAMKSVSVPVAEGDRFRIEGLRSTILVLSVPGHTEEHVAYLVDNALFCGDTLFGAGCGRLLGGTASQLHHSLEKLAALPADTLVHPAHEYTLGNLRFAQLIEPDNPAISLRQSRCEQLRREGLPTVPTKLAEELETNPFLRTHVPQVRQQAMARANVRLDTGEAVFAALRAWKDTF